MQHAFPNDQPVFFEQTSGTAAWDFVKGSQTLTKDGMTLTRRVEAWISPDGRYRVQTTSLDGSGAYEEVAYDGHGNQLIKIVSNAGAIPKYAVVANTLHFAISDTPKATEKWTTSVHGQQLMKESKWSSGSQSVSYQADAITPHRGEAAALMVEVPAGAVVGDASSAFSHQSFDFLSGDALLSGQQGSASHGDITYNLLGDKCMTMRNYRNTSTQYFSASSRRTSNLSKDHACRWVDVSAWEFGFLNGHCVAGPVGFGPTDKNWSSWSGYANVAYWSKKHGSSRIAACSRHAAWDQYWWQHVSWEHFPAAIPG